MRHQISHQNGVSVIEVLIAISMTAVLIVGIGTSFSSIHRLNAASEYRQSSTEYAKQPLEQITAAADELFGCNCTDDSCIGGQCVRGTQTCVLPAGYTSCWTDLDVSNPMYLDTSGASPTLVSGTETIGDYERQIHIISLDSDYNRKQITSTVSWTQNGETKTTELTTRLTAWKNI